jgi:hypothetical protein
MGRRENNTNSKFKIQNSKLRKPDITKVCPYVSIAFFFQIGITSLVVPQVELPPLIPPMHWGETRKIQFSPLCKGRVREG